MRNGRLALQVIITASRKNVNRIGPRASPCLTPMLHVIVCVCDVIHSEFYLKLFIEGFQKAISFGGTPNFCRIKPK